MFNTPKELPSISPPKPLPEFNKNPKSDQISPPLSMPIIAPSQPPQEVKKPFHLPIIETPKQPDIILPKINKEPATILIQEDTKSFDDAILNIHNDIMKQNKQEDTKFSTNTNINNPPLESNKQEHSYYEPKDNDAGEGYFSEIKHYLENKDIHSILDDLLKKDMLIGMKDYHDQQTQGKPYYLHSHDLQHKLERKMHALMKREQEWHDLQRLLDEKNSRKIMLEHEIDDEAQDLKELFTLIRSSEVLSKQAPESQQFTLINGQKLKCLNDLRKALSYMKPEEFNHHVNSERNDFANWTRGSLLLNQLADKMSNLKTKQEIELLLKRPI